MKEIMQRGRNKNAKSDGIAQTPTGGKAKFYGVMQPKAEASSGI
jgi:hypothetical protein